MLRYLLRRLIWLMLVILAVSLITFVLMHQIPGGPFDREKTLPAAIIANLEATYNLNAPLHEQYLLYMSEAFIPRIRTDAELRATNTDYLINIPLPGDTALRWMNFGPSYASRTRNVNAIFRENLPVSAQLGIAAILLASAVGIPLGILAAVRRDTPIDFVSMSVAILGVSIPSITLGPLLRYVFGVNLKWLPPTGWGGIEYLILPAITLGLGSSAVLARLTRASLLQVLNEDFIRTARAKGLYERQVILGHGLRNSLIPVVTIFGPFFAGVVTGTFAVEQIFAIPGMGRYFITSVNGRDYPVIMGTILLYAFILVLANFVVDFVYALLDPRIRY